MEENHIQDIANATAQTTIQAFLQKIPSDVLQALTPEFCASLEKDLQGELQEIIRSRLSWSQQAVQLELAEQQRLKKAEAVAEPSETESPPQGIVPASQPVGKRQTPTSRQVIKLQKPHVPLKSQPTPPLQYTQLDFLALSEPEQPKPHRRPSVLEPSREEILKQYNLKPENFFQSRDSDVMPRRRRRRATAGTG